MLILLILSFNEIFSDVIQKGASFLQVRNSSFDWLSSWMYLFSAWIYQGSLASYLTKMIWKPKKKKKLYFGQDYTKEKKTRNNPISSSS